MTTNEGHPLPEVWGGVECTVNRVGGRYHDQLELTGHARRPADLELIAGLGVKALRYPVLWERTAPHEPGRLNWSWADARLTKLRELGVRPIVGLLHHGSGPRYAGILCPGFAEGLADFAGRVAERFPWADAYTPVNEPLTTARFCALYGHWHPHARDGLSFARALLAQCRAVVLAMRAVRRVRSDAQLVQTEDLGKTHATRALRYQADFENERRWLTFDLLRGLVGRGHPMADYFLFLGVPEAELFWFLDNPCPPDVSGFNYYLTSERFLDEQLERYPPEAHGGNGRHAYADVEAVRVGGPAGLGTLLREAWERYRAPLAVTESHLACSREEQLRWLAEGWDAACRLRREGVDVRAFTAWALLGACDWDSLVTRPRGHYEPGAFDVRHGKPRPTALAALIRRFASGAAPDLPALEGPGWWARPERILYPRRGNNSFPASQGRSRPLLIAGGGALGGAVARLCQRRGLAHRLLSRHEMDIASPASVSEALRQLRPWAVLNAAGYTRVDEAEREAEACRRENLMGPAVLAEACGQAGLPLVAFSSDLVFDGRRHSPYRESDPANPCSFYGRCKAEAEKAVLAACPEALVVRAGAFFGPWHQHNFVAQALAALRRRERLIAPEDLTFSPTYLPDLADACLDLLIDGERGVWHVANQGEATWAGLARATARGAGLDEGLAEGRPAEWFTWAAPRPPYSALGSERGVFLPHWEDALGRFLAEWRGAPGEDRPPGRAWGGELVTEAALG